MINWILGGLLAVAVFFAARYVVGKLKKGECVGCSGGKEGCHCCHTSKQ